MKKIRIKFKYSLNLEVQRVVYTLKKIDWYINRGYKVNLPLKLEQTRIEVIDKKHIRNLLQEEYRLNNYRSVIFGVKKRWDKVSNTLMIQSQKTGLNFAKEYIIFLTKYGVGGSYKLPNKIVINFHSRKAPYILETIIHEIIHLSIEDIISKFNIDHWEKERLVDLIFLKMFPKSNKIQKLPIKTKRIDRIFNSFYPDIKKVSYQIVK